MLFNIGMQYKIITGLEADIKYQYQIQSENSEDVNDTSSYYTRNLINLFSQLDRATGIVKRIVPVGSIATIGNNELRSQNFRAQLNYNYTFNNRHRVIAIAGTEIRQTENKGSAVTYYGYSPDPLNFTNLDVVNTYPNFITGFPMSLTGNAPLTNTDYRFLSFFGNASYTYNNRYSLSGSLRKDGSNIFGANTNDKWKPLWSAGMSWNISKESFYDFNAMPQLRLSYTFGYSGNVDLTKTALPVGGYGTDRLSQLPYVRITKLNDPNLRWEQVYQSNIKLDFTLRNKKVSGTVEYYHKKGDDLYGVTPYDYTVGGISSTITKNVAKMRADGLDITLNTYNINRIIKWNTMFLFSWYKDKTLEYYSQLANPVADYIGNGNSISPVVGKPLYALVAYRWGGLDASGNPQGYIEGTKSSDYNAIRNAAYNKGDASGSYVLVGSSNPTVFGSVFNTLSWKQINIGFNITYKMGYYLFKPSLSYYNMFENGIGDKEYSTRWQQPGDELKTNVPAIIYPVNNERDYFYQGSEANVIKGDHIRLQFINVNYAVPAFKTSYFKNINCYLNAANIGVVWRSNRNEIDPDYLIGFTPSKTYTVGVRADF